MIHYLRHNEIDKTKWDQCISNDPNGLVYGLSWYLDIVSPGWEAIAEDNYGTIMPLPCKRKFGIDYIIQPLFCQQLGIFGNNADKEECFEVFINSIPAKFDYIKVNFNSFNTIRNDRNKTIKLINQKLSLNPDYSELMKAYDESTKKNLRRAEKADISILENVSIEEFIRFKKSENAAYMKKGTIDTFKLLANQLIKRNNIKLLAAKNNLDNKIIAFGLFIIYKYNITLMISGNSEEGKQKKAMFLIKDTFIKNYSASKFTLDFAGSNIAGIHYFNSGFGAYETYYKQLVLNRLFWPLKYLKK